MLSIDALDPGGPRTLQEMRVRAAERACRMRNAAYDYRPVPQITEEAFEENPLEKPNPPIPITEDISRQMAEAHRFLDSVLGPSPHKIISIVAAYYNITEAELLSAGRGTATKKHVAIYLIHKLTKSSYPKIAWYFGMVDHTSAIYAVKKIAQLLKKDKSIADDIAEIRRIIGA